MRRQTEMRRVVGVLAAQFGLILRVLLINWDRLAIAAGLFACLYTLVVIDERLSHLALGLWVIGATLILSGGRRR